ncbi:MAG: hypothetical protein JRG90_12635 [Deltaproteobacteria bacterium]|nr:hypothetical protein [Deltaproteobacteria bacterium]
MKIQIPVVQLEFDEGHHTLWVHSAEGTVLRIKCSGTITVNRRGVGLAPHADIWVDGDIDFNAPRKVQHAH